MHFQLFIFKCTLLFRFDCKALSCNWVFFKISIITYLVICILLTDIVT